RISGARRSPGNRGRRRRTSRRAAELRSAGDRLTGMRRLVSLIAIAALVVGFVALFWGFEYRQRATRAQVTRAVYREFGRRGARIRRFAQNGNGATWKLAGQGWGEN